MATLWLERQRAGDDVYLRLGHNHTTTARPTFANATRMGAMDPGSESTAERFDQQLLLLRDRLHDLQWDSLLPNQLNVHYIRICYHDGKAEPVPEVTRALDDAF